MSIYTHICIYIYIYVYMYIYIYVYIYHVSFSIIKRSVSVTTCYSIDESMWRENHHGAGWMRRPRSGPVRWSRRCGSGCFPKPFSGDFGGFHGISWDSMGFKGISSMCFVTGCLNGDVLWGSMNSSMWYGYNVWMNCNDLTSRHQNHVLVMGNKVSEF